MDAEFVEEINEQEDSLQRPSFLEPGEFVHKMRSISEEEAISLLPRVETVDERDTRGFTPFIYCAVRDFVNLGQELLQRGADINATTVIGDAAVHWYTVPVSVGHNIAGPDTRATCSFYVFYYNMAQITTSAGRT